MCAYNFFKTWQARPAAYNIPVIQAPALSAHYQDPPLPEPRLKDAPVVGWAISLDRWTQLFWHRRWECRPLIFTFWTITAVVVASLFEIVPTFLVRSNIPTITSVKPYTPLELIGRDIYVSEGCYNCHSQMIRPILAETKRYGEYSKPGEFVYDHPFQWGSRRIGPDLAREGGKQSPLWHIRHFQNPSDVTPKSIMPPYPWLLNKSLDFKSISKRVEVMTHLGVPYTSEEVLGAEKLARAQAKDMADDIAKQGGPTGLEDKEVIAVVAYLQRLGVDLHKAPEPTAPATPSTPPAEEKKAVVEIILGAPAHD